MAESHGVSCTECSAEEEEENKEQQAVELETLVSIYSEITIVEHGTEFLIEVDPYLDSEVQLVLLPQHPLFSNHLQTLPGSLPSSSTSSNTSCPHEEPHSPHSTTTTVTHLPPLSLFIRYHSAYPSRGPPIFHLSGRWVDSEKCRFATETMRGMFTADCPVVFDWINYLKDEFLSEYVEWKQSQEGEKGEREKNSLPPLPQQSPATKHHCQVFLRSTSQFNDIEAFNEYECHREFLRSKHECSICFLQVPGEEFSEPCTQCGQAFCSQCLLSYCQTRIGEGQVNGLDCPNSSCSHCLSDALLEGLLPPPLLKRYFHLRDEVELDSIPGMVFCPRSMCRSRVVSDPDSDLAVCGQCGFPFCKLCQLTWHGPGTCPAVTKVAALQQEGERAAASVALKVKKKDAAEEQKKVDEMKTLVWIRASGNVQPCPKCGANIQKYGGCNKMTCRKCSSNFCWLCGKIIAGYNHFTSDACPLFRPSDYLQHKSKKIFIPDSKEVMQNALTSNCPRCEHTMTKRMDNNWMRCARCTFQYCHLCQEPCFGLWHFNEYGCRQSTTIQQDFKYFSVVSRGRGEIDIEKPT